ncbi:RBBP8 N-terminal-like protein isoform X2 [Microcaecilia unicolor]|uniref:RBBP8 N-terminal-like protein isoform X2 n=1 Tax=Microcaecilia unicolor TaxID=1415580 RepID=A0A6P7YXV5_9AMPH|nr:RBBP8 N-terminal-like protein isoform X2 [Microcaecilia unicolor]
MQNKIQSIRRNWLRLLLLSNNMETFSDVLNKLKEIHEKEVQGLQANLTEITMERCRDTRRIEELFAKNHLLREQQKALNENVKVLENRLRAGLCDRCTVTQELAKKKQQEYEGSHIQSLQLISSLTNELRGLKEENTSLREELGKPRNLETENQRAVPPDKGSCLDLPIPLVSPVNATNSTEKPPSKEKESYEDLPFPQSAEEKSFGPGNSPAATHSPARTVQDMCLFDIVCMNPQRISNQLHGTIAVVRPGGKSCLSETSSWTRTSPSAIYYHSNHDKQLRGNSPDSCDITSCQETTCQQGSREEQLSLLSQHFSQGRFSLQSAGISAERVLNQVPKTREIEVVRRRSLNELEEHSSVLELQGGVLYRSERRRHSIAEQRERLQYFLARQQDQQKQRARAEAFRSQIVNNDGQEEKGQCLPQTLWANQNKHEREWSENDWEGKCSVLTSTKKSESNEKQEASSSSLLDKPLDLSDYGRIRESSCHMRQHKSSLPSPPSRENPASPQNVTGPNALQKGDPESSLQESSQLHAGSPFNSDNETQQLRAQDAKDFVPVLEVSLSPPGDSPKYNPAGDPGIQVIKRQKQERQDLEDNDGADSRKGEADEPDTSDSETGPETEQNQQGKDREYLCITAKAQHSKRKGGHNHWIKGRGNKKVKAIQTPIEGTVGNEKEANNSEPCSEDTLGET